MKKFSVLFIVSVFALSSCGEKEDFTNAEVEINCTGTYLNMDNLYFKVCNIEVLEGKEDGETINVNVKHLDDCEESQDGPICLMAFHSDGWVEILYQY